MKNAPPSLDEFQTLCRRYFSYLTEQFGFRELPATEGSANPFSVSYAKDDLVITAEGINYGQGVNVVFRHRSPLRIGFAHLLRLRDPAALVACTGGEGQRRQLEEFATALRTHASDLLAGDLEVLKTAKEEQEKAHRDYCRQQQRLPRQQAKPRRHAGKTKKPRNEG